MFIFMPIFIYLQEDSQFGKIKIRLEASMWEGFKCIFQPLILQVNPEDETSTQECLLEQLQVTKNQIVKFILEYRNNPYLKMFVKPLLEMVNAFYEITRWLRVCCTITLEKLAISCENFPTTFCTKLEEILLQIRQTIIQHLPSIGIPELFDLECFKDFIREAEETKLLPSDVESHYAQQLAQVIAQLELDEQLWKNRSRVEIVSYIRLFVKASEEYVNRSLDCIKPDFKGDKAKYTTWRYIDEARKEARNFNKM